MTGTLFHCISINRVMVSIAWVASVLLCPQLAIASGSSTLSSDIDFWEQPRIGASAGKQAAGVLGRGTIVEVVHKMADGRGGQQSYVRVSSGPYTGRYVWVGSNYPPAETQGGTQTQARNQFSNQNLQTQNPQTMMEARLTPCDLGLCNSAPDSSRNSGLGKVQVAATQMRNILSSIGGSTPQLGQDVLDKVTWGEKEEGPQWTSIAANAVDTLGPELLESEPADIKAFCPSYVGWDQISDPGAAKRKGFWVQFLSALVEKESTFRPHVFKTEKFKDSSKQYVVSRGLLQLSRESAQNYGCPVETGQELHDPQVNLECGVRILVKRTTSANRIAGTPNKKAQGAAKYWSALQRPKVLKAIQSKTRAYCQALAPVQSV